MTDEIARFVAQANGGRLDKFLAEATGLTRNRVQQLIAAGAATVNGRVAKPGYKLEPGDLVEATLLPPPTIRMEPQAISLSVAYQDEDLIIIDKPAGLIVHPAPGHPDRTLVNAVLALCPELQTPSFPEPVEGRRRASTSSGNAYLRPGIVHRLDKDTSGLMVVAKHPAAQEHLARQLRDRTMDKEYIALVEGRLSPERGAIEAPIGRDPRRRNRMAVVDRGRASRTGYRVREYVGRHTLISAFLETGRTHQIRVHFSAIAHPVVGDAVYGHAVPWCPRQFLHAYRLGFEHPRDGRHVEFTAELPPDLRAALEAAKTQ